MFFSVSFSDNLRFKSNLLAQKLSIFDDSKFMATFKANISGKEHDIDNWATALETINGSVHRRKTS